jgi:hypothetical protein
MAKKDKKKKEQPKADESIPLVEQFKLEYFFIDVTLSGIADLMFDKFIDHSKEKRPVEQKLYLIDKDKMILPAENIYSFLNGDNPAGAIRTVEKRGARDYLQVSKGHIMVNPQVIPIVDDNGGEIRWDKEDAKFYIYEMAGRTGPPSQRVKQEAQPRPVLKLPWHVNFKLTVVKNNLIDEYKLEAWFRHGGLLVGLCNNRPRFGRFFVSNWQVESPV